MSAARSRSRAQRPRAAAAVNADESPIAWLRRRKDRSGEAMISQAQFDAGERLRADFFFAQMTPRTTTNWASLSPRQRGRRYGAARQAGADMLDNAAAAGERVRRALSAVGPELSGVLIDVCCYLKGLEEAERDAGWPQRSAKIVLQLALTRLARHYGLETVTQGRGAGIVRHWGGADYRPLFDVPADDAS
ncbi:MAG: DUF6456 domain-containing protein [Hyphomicrobium sp.]|uniref:DUF6456 domain-containing protein n=1 Tax=Hyphomicrobium sp. TaxID=82 RepID=UPI0013218774|nr:DUF6456 domain-containing protein [Hyphomicrobium sp.]KAB2940557.1 MAG: DNA replication protein [Hyphomicrobium sp.]MBZ0210341.1 DUF6456 domain-containing protein [Hyphomicrobium sp.]MCZ7595238.1 DUF6456 domain-containing protein [Hyphomicrobium sp.]